MNRTNPLDLKLECSRKVLFLVEFLQVFRGVLVEILKTGFAAKFHFPAIVGEDMRFSHFTEFLARDNAGIQRIRFGRFRGFIRGWLLFDFLFSGPR